MNRLCIGLATIAGRSSCANKLDFQVTLELLVLNASNKKKDIRMWQWYQKLLTSGFPFSEPTTTNDLYDVVSYQIANNSPPTSIANWSSDFFHSFTISGYSSLNYYVTVGIPEIVFQNSIGNATKPLLILPDPYAFDFPATAYYYDVTSSSVKEVIMADEDDLMDAMEGGNYYVWKMSYEYDEDDEKVNHNCPPEGYSTGDYFCDGNCGENATNSPFDCAIQNTKTLYLKKIRICEDFRSKTGGKCERKHWESSLSNNYEPAFSCWAIQANGRVSSIERRRLEDLSNDNVKRSRKKGSGRVSRGTSIWVDAKDRKTGDEPIVAENYNPYRTVLYYFIYEHDPLKRYLDHIPFTYSGNNIGEAKWHGNNMTAGKYNSCAWGLDATVTEVSYRDRIDPLPSQWVSELSPSGDPIMTYTFQVTGDNKVNYQLYYFVNKSKK